MPIEEMLDALDNLLSAELLRLDDPTDCDAWKGYSRSKRLFEPASFKLHSL